MRGIKRERTVGAPDSDLLTDLATAIKQQQEKDGTMCTPFDSAREAREVLTARWAGTKITASVAEDSPAAVYKHGIREKDEFGDTSPVRFTEAEGEIESVSPAYGGYIALTNGEQVVLPNRGTTRPLPVQKLGLEVEVLPA